MTLLFSSLVACIGESTDGAASLTSTDDAALTNPASAPIVAESAYFRLPIPGRDVSSAYLTLRNNSPQAGGLTAFTSEQVRAIELHEHVHVLSNASLLVTHVLSNSNKERMQRAYYYYTYPS